MEATHASQKSKYLVLLGLAAIFIAIGLYFSPSLQDLVDGYVSVLTHPTTEDYDFLVHIGHLGTAYFNAGVLLLCVILVYGLTGTQIRGIQIAAAMTVAGFSFFGKDVVNIWFPVIGVIAYSAYRRRPLSSVTAIAFFSTALAPVYSVTVYGTDAIPNASVQAYAVGMALGILGGVLVGMFTDHLPTLHKGYILFNAGFAAGFAGIFINALRRSINIGHAAYPSFQNDFIEGANLPLGITLVIMFGYMIVIGLAFGGGPGFVKMLGHRSKGGDYVEPFGFFPCLINMGLMGLIGVGYVFLTLKGHLNGSVFAAIFTACGFAACGLTARTFLPTMAGVYITAFVTGGIGGLVVDSAFLTGAIEKTSSSTMLLAAIFSCGMSPIVGRHGILAGLLVGGAHCLLVPTTGLFHGWMSLYNNALSLSIVATFLHPVYSKLGMTEETAAAEA